jgi:hypothetical protein
MLTFSLTKAGKGSCCADKVAELYSSAGLDLGELATSKSLVLGRMLPGLSCPVLCCDRAGNHNGLSGAGGLTLSCPCFPPGMLHVCSSYRCRMQCFSVD